MSAAWVKGLCQTILGDVTAVHNGNRQDELSQGDTEAGSDTSDCGVSRRELQTKIETANHEGSLKATNIKDSEENVMLPKKRSQEMQPSSSTDCHSTDKAQGTKYLKKKGTSNTGHLYETKLLTLVFIRLMDWVRRGRIEDFKLGCNVKGLGALDDLVVCLLVKGKQLLYLVQAKHKNSVDKLLTVDKISTVDGEFSLCRYLKSYVDVLKQLIDGTTFKNLWSGNLDDIKLLIFTPVKEAFEVDTNKYDTHSTLLFYTKESGNTIKFNNSDRFVDFLVKIVNVAKVKQLAKIFMQTVKTEEKDFNNYHELLKTYHVFLAQNVVDVAKGTFLEQFYNSNDDVVVLLRKTIYKMLFAAIDNPNTKLLYLKQLLDKLFENPTADTLMPLLGTVLCYDFKSKTLKWNKKEKSNKLTQSFNLSRLTIPIEVVMEVMSQKIIDDNKLDLKDVEILLTSFISEPTSQKLDMLLGRIVYYRNGRLELYEDMKLFKDFWNLETVAIPVKVVVDTMSKKKISTLKACDFKAIEEFNINPKSKTLGPLLDNIIVYHENKLEFAKNVPEQIKQNINETKILDVIEDIKKKLNDFHKNQSEKTFSDLLGDLIIYEPNEDKFILSRNVPLDIKTKCELPTLRHQTFVENALEVAGKIEARRVKIDLPSHFGNSIFIASERRLHSLAAFIVRLIEKANDVVMITDENIKTLDAQLLQSGDMVTKANGGLAGLVGTLLILDKTTQTLKFNDNEETLQDNVKNLLKIIKKEIGAKENLQCKDIANIRFQIKMNRFPKLNVTNENADKEMVEGFLNKLFFYTDQAQEKELDGIIKENMKCYINSHLKSVQDKDLCLMKADLIYLKLHDFIQNWWKNPNGNYLTKTCDFLEKAMRQVVESSMLIISKSLSLQEIYKYNINFDVNGNLQYQTHLNAFLNGDKTMAVIKSKEKQWSTIKLIQFLNKETDNFFVLDLNLTIIQRNIDVIEKELKELKPKTLVVVCAQDVLSVVFSQKCQGIKFLFLITESMLHNLNQDFTVLNDQRDTLLALDAPSQLAILSNKFTFQGKLVSWKDVIDNGAIHLLCPKMCMNILNGVPIAIGAPVRDEKYIDTENAYIVRHISDENNPIIIKRELFEQLKQEFFVWRHVDNNLFPVTRPSPSQDVLIIKSAINKHSLSEYDMYRNHNIHFFKSIKEPGRPAELVWVDTLGSRSKLAKYRVSVTVNTVADHKDNVVILIGDAGAGKSLFLSHLTAATKNRYPALWVLRTNLLESHNVNIFHNWQTKNIDLSLKDAILFLYNVANLKAIQGNDFSANDLHVSGVDNYNRLKYKNNSIDRTHSFEIDIFNHICEHKRMVLLFDGFNEICMKYKDPVLKMLVALKRAKIGRMWVTVRPCEHVSELQIKMNEYPRHLDALSTDDQVEYLATCWKNAMDGTRDNNNTAVKNFLENHIFPVLDGRFTGNLLNLQAIAEVYKHDFELYLSNKSIRKPIIFPNSSNLYKLFKKVTDERFNLRYSEKMSANFHLDPSADTIIEQKRKEYDESHELYGFIKVFGFKGNTHSITGICMARDVMKLKNKLDTKIGIVQNTGSDFIFSHPSFGEFYAVQFLCRKLISKDSDKKERNFVRNFISKEVLRNPDLARFFHSKSEADTRFQVVALPSHFERFST